MSSTESQIHYRVCNLCEAMCGIQATLSESGSSGDIEIVIKPDPLDPFSKGSMCPKAPALAALHTDPSRLRTPVKRIDGEWVDISWDEAYATIEANIKRIRKEHGADSIASYLGNPIVHNMGMMLFVKTLTKAIGSRNVFSATSMDQLPHHFAAHFMFGHEFRIPVPDVDRTDFMILMGANPIASNGSIMTSAGIRERLKAIEERGGQFVVLDPRLTETAKIATAHHFIRPGTDVFFLLAFLHILFRDQHIDLQHLPDHIVGLEAMNEVVDAVTPAQAELLTGVSASVIESLVKDYTQQDRAVLYGRMGLSTQRYGGLCHWLINSINILSGHFDKPGGMMFPTPAIELARGRHKQQPFGRWTSRVRKMPEFYGELPVSAMTEELTTEGAGQVRAFMTVCGNPVLSTPGGNRLDAALQNVEFMFSIDNYINETTRHADIILPTPSGLEIEHYDLIFNLISVSNNAKYSEALFPADDDQPRDWQVLKVLIERLSTNSPGFMHRFLTPRRVINLGLMLGAYGKLSHPKRWFSGLTLNKVIASTHGIRLGPMVSRVPEGMLTPDRKIHLAPSVFITALRSLIEEQDKQEHETDVLDASTVKAEQRPFHLIGRRHVSTNNSWMHQFKKLSASRQVRCTAMINTDDAKRLQIVDQQTITVSSAVGVISLPAEVTDTVMQGVISIPHGFGHTKSGTRIPHAEAKPGVSVNDITDYNHVDALTGNAAFSGLPVSVEKVGDIQETASISGKPLVVLYGSRTGNAEFAAQDIAKRASEHGMLAQAVAMDDVEASELLDIERILIVCSTYGEGDMPDNAQALWDIFSASDTPRLDRSHYSVLAFGDSSYVTFCEAGKQWDKRLNELGATRILDRTDCDVNDENAAEQWIDAVLPMISNVGDQATIDTASILSSQSTVRRFTRNNPLPAKVLEKYSLTKQGSSKQTFHISLSLAEEDLSYNAGGTINVIAENRHSLVVELLNVVNGDADELVGEGTETLYKRLLQDLEIRVPSRALLAAIAEQTHDESVRATLSGNDRSALDTYLWGQDVVSLLKTNPGVIASAEALCAVLSPLAPRSYSISSSINLHPNEVHLTVAAVRYEVDGREHHGVASCFLADQLEVNETLNVYFGPDNAFSLPEDDVAIIMIGPGTGVAPFRGFLQEREWRKAAGRSWLFFGDRQASTDFLYEQEIAEWQKLGVLNRLDLAFSRDQTEKIYVQHRMLENASEFFKWLEEGAVVYVCGDAEKMAKDVDDTLHSIVEKQGGISSDDAKAYIKQLVQDKRYLRDVY